MAESSYKESLTQQIQDAYASGMSSSDVIRSVYNSNSPVPAAPVGSTSKEELTKQIQDAYDSGYSTKDITSSYFNGKSYVQRANQPEEKPANPSWRERVGRTALGAAEQYAGSLLGTAASYYEGGTRGSQAEYERLGELAKEQVREAHESYRSALEKAQYNMDDKDVQRAKRILDSAINEQRMYQTATTDSVKAGLAKTADTFYGAANKVSEAGAKNIERAKQGASRLGSLAIDVGVGGLQMGADIGLAALAGGTNILPIMAARSYGGAALEARNAGASYERQVAYGGAVALTEILTEKLSDIPGLAGGGAVDHIADDIIRKLASNPKGMTALRYIGAFGSEFAEEAVSTLVNPATKAIYDGGKEFKELISSPEKRIEFVEDILYDGLVGGLLGTVGQGRAQLKGQDAVENAKLQIVNDAEKTLKEKGLSGKQAAEKAYIIEKALAGEALSESEKKVLGQNGDNMPAMFPSAKETLDEMRTAGRSRYNVDTRNPFQHLIDKRADKTIAKALDNITAEEVKNLSLEDVRAVLDEAKRLGHNKSVDILQREYDARIKRAQNDDAQAPEQTPETSGEDFGERVFYENTFNSLPDNVKQILELEDHNKIREAIKGIDPKMLEKLSDYAAYEQYFGHSAIIDDYLRSLKKSNATSGEVASKESENTEQANSADAAEESGNVESEPEAAPESEAASEPETTSETGTTPEPETPAEQGEASGEDSQQAQQPDQPAPQTIDDVVTQANAKTAKELTDALRAAAEQNSAIRDQIMNAKGNKIADGRTKLGRAIKALRAEWTETQENGTIEAQENPNQIGNVAEEANNAGEQVIQQPEAGTAGIPSSLAAEERGAGTVAEPQNGRPDESPKNRESAEDAGQPAEDVQSVGGSGEEAERSIQKSSRRLRPKWLTSEQDVADYENQKKGKRKSAPMGKSIFNLKKDGATGVIQTLPGTSVIETPGIGTVANMVFKILDAFGVKGHQRHIYSTKNFICFGDDGGVSTVKGASQAGDIAVAIDEKADIPIQQRAVNTAIHECGHRQLGKKFGLNGSLARIKSVNAQTNNDALSAVTVEDRSEYTYSVLVSCLRKIGLSKKGSLNIASELTRFWVETKENGGGFGYGIQYGIDGTLDDYVKSAKKLRNVAESDIDSLCKLALQKRASEEIVVDLLCRSDKISNLVDSGIISYKEARSLKSAALSILKADGVIDSKQADMLDTAFEALASYDFIQVENSESSDTVPSNPALTESESISSSAGTDSGSGIYLDGDGISPSSTAERSFADSKAKRTSSIDADQKQNKGPAVEVYETVESAAKSIAGLKTSFDSDDGMPVTIALDKKGRTYTVPKSVTSALKQIRNAANGIARGAHPIRSLDELVTLYDSFNRKGSDMAAFVTDEINDAFDEIKTIAGSKTLSDNQKVMKLEIATTRALNLVSARISQVDNAFKANIAMAKLLGDNTRSGNKLRQWAVGRAAAKSYDALLRWQINPTTLFKLAGNFDKASNNTAYKIARRIENGTARYQTLYYNAMSKFHELNSVEGFDEFARDKKKCPVKLGNIELTEQQAVDFIKRVNTLEKTILGGQKRIENIKGFAILQKDGSYTYIDQKTAGKKWTQLRNEMEKSLSPAAKKYMEITGDVMHELGSRVSDTKRKITGVGFWTMDKGIYYPLQYHAESQDSVDVMDDMTEIFGPTGEGIAQKRTREEGGYVVVQPASNTVDSYIEKACNYVGYGELSSQLFIMDNMGAGFTGFSNLVANNLGASLGKSMHNYINDLNNVKSGKQSDVNNLLKWGREHLASGALRFSLSVPMKQVPSYWTAMGVLSPEAVAKAWRFKLLKAAGYGSASAILGYRKIGGIDPTVSETLNNKDLLSSLKKRSKIVEAWDNAITTMDYRTVDNLYKATILDTAMKFPDIDQKSDLFSRMVEAKFQEVVMRTQPVYTRNARAEYARTDDEIIRGLSMFRTQQTQNLNNIITAVGEYRASRGGITESIARARLKATIAGQVTSYIEFGLLSIIADLALHKKKPYRDEDDEVSLGKFAERLGLNTLENAAGTIWFGDTVAKAMIDAISKASGGDLNEFYGVNFGVISTAKNAFDSFGYFLENPGFNNAKNAAGYVSQAFGVPLNNVYRALNSMTMYALDAATTLSDGKLGNRAAYDDSLKMLDKWIKGGLAEEEAKFQANKAFRRGDYENLLYNVNILEAEGAAKAKKEGKDDPHKGRDYLANRILGRTEAEREKAKAEEKERLGYNLSINDRITNYLVGSDLPDADIDKAIDSYVTAYSYNALYDAARKTGLSPRAAVKVLGEIDVDNSGEIAKSELKAYYKLHGDKQNKLVEALWGAKDYKTIIPDDGEYEKFTVHYDAVMNTGVSVARASSIVDACKNDQGSITQGAIYQYYLAHPDDEEQIKALFESMGYKQNGKAKTWDWFKKNYKPK